MQDREGRDEHMRRHRRWPVAVVVASVVAALALAACGGGGSSSSSSSSGTSTPAKKLTGAPIKAMTVASVNTQGPPFPQILETAKVYEKWINDNGGIAGHPLQVVTC